MNKKDKPNKVTAKLRVVVTGEFYDDEATEETLRYCVEQDLEDAGFDVDVELLKEQDAVEPKVIGENGFGHPVHACGKCGHLITESMNYCSWCGCKVGEWND